ncbi:uncharacterized protein LOC106070183 [Biomphalaria glabrata]|uniref:Uncharacterized protein LOC106070183 n=1 Tax=Biomphalaria glabrata TaxID=6526 RepID=A0A9U8EFE4_BIOGL|nr:uncharacterized protein LOC106070183 [Biomphalaria glabrata]XP_013085487.2 uncharacterized protein LOC106070183 [Biomphalaria glabrata]XP_013085495.2 uncharacterized protein LOC106070183 [Biomphalaria glabrata]XP_055892383.1 uncharacterized protein LOC106070183 [Biomphalaria glabrata]
MWGDSLIQRIEKPSWGQKRQFDIISKKIVLTPKEVPKLFHMCRSCILSLIPLCQIEQTSSQLPLPLIMRNNVLKLKLDDFRINPLKVQAQNLQTNSYLANYIHSGQEVEIKVQNTESDSCIGTYTNKLAILKDQGLDCCVLDPVIPLNEILRVLRRTNQTLTENFTWKVVEAVIHYIMTNSKGHHILQPTMIKVTKIYPKVFVESFDTELDQVKQKPPELETGFFYTEKTAIWFLGFILKEMLPLIASRQTKQILEKLVKMCFQPDPHKRCSATSAKNFVKQNKPEAS